jgi:hypothetical protein
LRPLIKYSVTLLILLLIGYSQLFAHLYAGYSSQPQATEKALNHEKAFGLKTPPLEGNYMCVEEEESEEDDKISLKALKDRTSFISIHPRADASSPITKNYSSFFKNLSFSSLFRSQYLVLCVFRI